MGLYDELKLKKELGEALDFITITCEQLEKLYYDEERSDAEIADLFDVPESKVRYKRRKCNINFQKRVIKKLLANTEFTNEMNEKIRKQIMIEPNIDMLARAVTCFAFGNGPVEEMHAKGQLSQEDIKTLNKFMVNRMAYIFQLIIEERWFEFGELICYNAKFCSDWDVAEPDDGGMREIILMSINQKS